jgi:uncharacterized phage infection (PIP) family protein YhgE
MDSRKIKRARRLLARECSLWKSPSMWLAGIAIILVPTINCSLFIGSMWDPFG